MGTDRENSSEKNPGFQSASASVEEHGESFTVEEILEWQRTLSEEYNWWQPNCPENGKDKLLWMLGEIGEVIDVIKKKGSQSILADAQVRAHFIEEMADVLMFYGDVMLCYGITADELKSAYREKATRNMTRWK